MDVSPWALQALVESVKKAQGVVPEDEPYLPENPEIPGIAQDDIIKKLTSSNDAASLLASTLLDCAKPPPPPPPRHVEDRRGKEAEGAQRRRWSHTPSRPAEDRRCRPYERGPAPPPRPTHQKRQRDNAGLRPHQEEIRDETGRVVHGLVRCSDARRRFYKCYTCIYYFPALDGYSNEEERRRCRTCRGLE